MITMHTKYLAPCKQAYDGYTIGVYLTAKWQMDKHFLIIYLSNLSYYFWLTTVPIAGIGTCAKDNDSLNRITNEATELH